MKILSALVATSLLACAIGAQAAEPPKESEHDQQLAALTKEVQNQQAAIVENQTKINEKLAAIAEALRQAKIYAGRGR